MRTWTSGWLLVQVERLAASSRSPCRTARGRARLTADVVVAVRAVLLVEPGEVEHLLGLLVLAQLGVGDDAVAVGGLEGGSMCSIFSNVRSASSKSADAVQVDAQVVHGLEVVRVDRQGLLVGVDGLVEAVHLVERQADVEEPAAVVGVDGDGGAELLEGLLPLALLEELLRRSTRRSASFQSLVSMVWPLACSLELWCPRTTNATCNLISFPGAWQAARSSNSE